MKSLKSRVSKLEFERGRASDLSLLSDAELDARMAELDARLDELTAQLVEVQHVER
jgi:uncharacterized small protein (DUF1192 family)